MNRAHPVASSAPMFIESAADFDDDSVARLATLKAR